MTAKFIDYAGENIALILARPNRRTHPKLSLSFPTDVTAHPLSKTESRRTFSRSARYTTEYLMTLRTAEEANELRMLLNQLKTQETLINREIRLV